MSEAAEPDMWTMSDDKLDKHYKLLCKKYHPDRNKDQDTTTEFQELTSLYEKIKEHRKTPLEIELMVSLSELYHGCIKDIQIPIPDSQSLPLFIPRGTMNKEQFTLYTARYRPVHVYIKEINDTKFIRDGYNLIVHLDITLVQALLGEPVSMGHFNGTLNIPTHIPHTNYRHIIHEMGMPIPTCTQTSTTMYGDLYVVYNVILPVDPCPDVVRELEH